MFLVLSRHRPARVRHRRRHCRDDRRGVPRPRRADAHRAAGRHRPHRCRHRDDPPLEPQHDQLRRRLRRQLRTVRHRRAHRGGPAVAGDLGAHGGARAAARRRILRAHAVRAGGHDADGDGVGSARHLPGARGAVARGLRAHRHPARVGQRRRGGFQVLHARRVLLGVLPLRHRVRVRRHRQHPSGPRRQPDCGAGHVADAAADARGGPAARRLRVQGVRGAVPHVDT